MKGVEIKDNTLRDSNCKTMVKQVSTHTYAMLEHECKKVRYKKLKTN